MKHRKINLAARQAFTLIELLVVIVIVAILAALITAAAVKAIAAANRTKNRVEIGQLENAGEAFKTRYKVSYIPSRILLSESGAGYAVQPTDPPWLAQLKTDSLGYLMQVWPRLNFSYTNPGPPTWQGIDWNGDGLQSADVILEGDQCLVFFLGGIPNNLLGSGSPNCTGFSTNTSNPAAHIAALALGPDVTQSYEFNSNRLVRVSPNANNPQRSTMFFAYLDTYGVSDGSGNIVAGMPYAYFSSYKTANGYNRYVSSGTSDCATIGVSPYCETVAAPIRYLKPSTFQIVSAGADRQFGSGGGPWTPANPTAVCPQGGTGYDDQSNFSSAPLGVGSE